MVGKIKNFLDERQSLFYCFFYGGLFCFALLLPFQDTSLSESPLRFLGKSPSFLFLCLTFFLAVLKFGVNKFSIFILFYVCAFNFLSFLNYCDYFSYGRSLQGKGINLFVLNFIFLIPLLFNVEKSTLPRNFGWVVLLSFLICFLGVFLVDIFHFSFFTSSFFHVDTIDQTRFRGFSYEPSMLATSIISLYLCYICINNKKISVFDLVFISFLLFFIQSKGGLLCFLISILIAFNSVFFSLKKRYVFLLLVMVFSSFCFLIFMFVLDFDKYTSTITRGTLVLVPLFSLLDHPFGVGYFGFLDVFHQYLPSAVEFSKEYIHHDSGFREIDKYLVADTDSSIGSKSFFLNNVIVFGWPFIFLYFYSLFSAVKKCRSISRKDLEVLVWFIFLSLTLFVEGVGLYALSLGFLVCKYEMHCVNKKNNER
ncbi:hypothetical protein V6238_05450 [Marinomonas arenicola]|uniref:hypothetical protein n=1 Tax=Marinomonas arenicola TaxID=569601 RepID=UPI00311DAD9D